MHLVLYVVNYDIMLTSSENKFLLVGKSGERVNIVSAYAMLVGVP